MSRTPTELAAALRVMGLSKSYASELANGRRKPSLALATRIEAQLGVPAASWFAEFSQLANNQSDQSSAVKEFANGVRG